MAIEWPVDKLTMCQRALLLAGDNIPQTEDDGSDEWNVASAAYETAFAYMMENHGWSFATKVAILTPTGIAPLDDQFDTAYALPPDLCHLIWLRLSDAPTVYDIQNNQIYVNAQGGPPPPSPAIVPGVVTIQYVSYDAADPTRTTPTFILALQSFTMSGVYRGLHEDVAESDKLWAAGDAILGRARARSDQQKPKRAIFNSRIIASRRIRRPWPPMPSGWSGSGIPG